MLKTLGMSNDEMIAFIQDHGPQKFAETRRSLRERFPDLDLDDPLLVAAKEYAMAYSSAVVAVVAENNDKILADLRDQGIIRG